MTAHPTWIGEFVKRAPKSVSSRIEVGAVRGTAGRTTEPHILGQRIVPPISNVESKGQKLQRAAWR